MFAFSVAVIAAGSFPSVGPLLPESKLADGACPEWLEKASVEPSGFFVDALSIDDMLIGVKNIRVLVCKMIASQNDCYCVLSIRRVSQLVQKSSLSYSHRAGT
jgi:hypothetical protein